MIERIFLGWTAPALERAASLLVERYRDGAEVRMEGATVVLPGARAGRRLLERLLEEAERAGARLFPPRVTTIGALPEMLYEPARPLAGDVLARRAWGRALRGMDRARLAEVFPTLPAADDARGWATLARQLERLHEAVGAGGLGFADVARQCSVGLLHDDSGRWSILADVQEAYLATLARLGYDDRQWARMDALARGAIATDQEVWLVGIVDAPPVVRRMLEAVAGPPVRALVHAPEELADRFDALGCVIPEAWADAEIEVPEGRLVFVERPADQASAALRAVAALGARYAAEEITVGVPDTGIVAYLEREFRAAGVPARYAVGVQLSRTAPYRLLAAIAAYLDGRRYDAFAALIRHPDLGRWLARALAAGDARSVEHEPGAAAGARHAHSARDPDWILGIADRYFTESLPAHVEGPLSGDGRLRDALDAAVRALDSNRMLGRLQGKRRLAEWAPIILELLVEVYADDVERRGDAAARGIVAACDVIRDAAESFFRLPEAADESCDAVTAIRLLLDEVASAAIPPDADHPAVELLGWLELHLDDAPAMVITGLNEPHVPESVSADAFLPNALRARLGLADNARRYARDAYALAAILASRPEVWLISGRRDAAGDPLRPSRLLFAAPPRTVAERVRRFFGAEGGDRTEAGTAEALGAGAATGTGDGAHSGAATGAGGGVGSGADANARTDAAADVAGPGVSAHAEPPSGFVLPPEPELRAPATIEELRVTDFRLLLNDPYLFALERVLGLETIADDAREMDGALFGSLAHDVLSRFAGSDVAASTDAEAIARRLDELLDEEVRRRFGRSALPAVTVQVEQLRARLHAFAAWQAQWAVAGWRIAASEVQPPERSVAFDVDGLPIYLSGRIDRIDHNEATGEWAVLDYKTSDRGEGPEKTHRRGRGDDKRWVDLQLPLYRHLLPALRDRDGAPIVPPDAVDRVRLGYILLPRDLAAVGAEFANWSAEDLANADEAARNAVHALRENRFVFDPERTSVRPGDPFARLLGLGQLAGAAVGDEEVGNE
ncbi:MAG TPA: PD-(D/E)XK nuclease family protein [Longimicrobiales bacterium]